LALLLAVSAGLLALTRRLAPEPVATPPLIVEVRGDVPAPGFHAVLPPLTVHGALRAAGLDPANLADASLRPGTRVIHADGAVRLEPMEDLLVVGLPIDLNRAPARALTAIPGLGERRASDIVADRRAHGPFASVDDLSRVRGVGPATVERVRPFVSVTAPAP
jgi:competence protein ComEA